MESSKIKSLPHLPGVYVFKDESGTPIYVGKAVDVRKRVEQHFSGAPIDPREDVLRKKAVDVEVFTTRNEVEALILENNLIKRFKPALNVMLKDDKTYPYIKVTKEEYPRVLLTRRLLDDGATYLGPYTSPSAARLTIKHLRQVFPIRSCSLELGKKSYRPCLDYHIKLCSAPCAHFISKEDYLKLVEGFVSVLKGSYKRVLAQLYEEMEEASSQLRFEEAARLRDRIFALERISTKQFAQLPGWADYDVFAVSGDAGAVLHFRKGALVGREVIRIKAPQGIPKEKLVAEFIELFYSSGRIPSATVIAEVSKEDAHVLKSWLITKNPECEVRPPKNLKEKELLEMCYANLPQTTKEDALKELARILKIQSAHVIHGFDVSNLGASYPYVSAVCFKDGEPDRRNYRVYKIKWVKGQNDFAMIREAVFRHARHIKSGELPKPDLILIDGGPIQLSYAKQALLMAHMDTPVISLAKKEEIIYDTEGKELRLPRSNPALQILQHVRDEAHRFALKHHRKKRRKESLKSALEEVKGIGRVRLSRILERYPTLESLKKANLDSLCKIPGISKTLAQRILFVIKERQTSP